LATGIPNNAKQEITTKVMSKLMMTMLPIKIAQAMPIHNNALKNNTNGKRNTAIGYNALVNNFSGSNNIGIGHFTLGTNSIGYQNTGIGDSALFNNTTGIKNTGIGL
jgi:hypothetical protein